MKERKPTEAENSFESPKTMSSQMELMLLGLE